MGPSPMLRGMLEAGVVVAGFLAFGLLWSAYAPRMARAEAPSELWLVDGYNVVCAGLLGGRERERFWNEPNRRELLERLERFEEPRAEVWAVFDGAEEPAAAPTGRVRTVFSSPADDWILAAVRERAEARPVVVVTADRRLAGRARHRGARVVAPAELLRRCPGCLPGNPGRP